MTTATKTRKNCEECAEPGARQMTIDFGHGDTITAKLCGTDCRAAIQARAAEWRNSPEGREAVARQEHEMSTTETYEGRIRHAYQLMIEVEGGKPGDYVMIADLRPYIGGHRPYVDDALRSLDHAADVHIAPESNQKVLTPYQRDGAVQIGGQAQHLISIR